MGMASRRHTHSKTGSRADGPQAGLPGVAGPSRPEPRDGRTSRPPIGESDPRRKPNRGPPDSTLGPTRSAAVLIGATAAMTTAAMAVRFDVLFDATQTPNSSIASSVTGAAMIALSIGVRLPQRIAVWVCARAWRRVVSRDEAAPISELLLEDVPTDRHLHWTVLSVVALGTGILVAMLPVILRLASVVYVWLQAHFLWPAGPLAVLHAAIIFTSAFLPLALLGIAVSCTHHLSCRHGRWETSATAWLIIGAAIGSSAFAALRYASQRADLLLIAGALPSLLLSLVAALACSRCEPELDDPKESVGPPAPISGLRRPRIVRIGIVGAASTAACLVCVLPPLAADSMMDRATSLTLLLIATGVGALAGCSRLGETGLPGRSDSPSIGVFGMTCLCAGVLTALSAVCFGLAPQMPGPLMVAAACAAASASGLAMTYGRRALIQRVASRPTVSAPRPNSGAIILARSLMYAGLTVWIFAPTAERIAGPQAAAWVVALVLLVVGGILATGQTGSTGPEATAGVALDL